MSTRIKYLVVYLTKEVQNLYPENYKIVLKEIKDESQAGTKIAGGNINNLRYEEDITLMAESKEELKSLLMKVKEESEKADLNFNISKNEDHDIQFHHSLANRWEKMETGTDFIFPSSKSLCMVTAAMTLKDTCSLEEKLWQT